MLPWCLDFEPICCFLAHQKMCIWIDFTMAREAGRWTAELLTIRVFPLHALYNRIILLNWLLVKTTLTYIVFFSYILIGGKVIQSWCRYFGNIWDKKGWKEIQRLLWLSWNLWSNSFDPQKDNLWCPGTRNLVAENNLTFHYHFYCHFGKHVMNSEQQVNHIYWASLHKQPSILQCGENTEEVPAHISKIRLADAYNLMMIWDPNKVVSMIASKRRLSVFKRTKIANVISLWGRAGYRTTHTEPHK